MIDEQEKVRRVLLLSHALWDVRQELVDDAERQIDPENLDWFARERFDAALEENRRAFRALEEFRLRSAYDSESVSVSCTQVEQSSVRHLASGILTGELSGEDAMDQLWSDGFPLELSQCPNSPPHRRPDW